MTDDPVSGLHKQRRGRWQKGESGNPNGRPPGVKNRVTVIAEKMMAAQTRAAMAAILDEAIANRNPTMLKFIGDRIAPMRKGRTVTLSLPHIKKPADCVRAMEYIAGAVATGRISPDEASDLASVVETARKTLETVDLAADLAAWRASQDGMIERETDSE